MLDVNRVSPHAWRRSRQHRGGGIFRSSTRKTSLTSWPCSFVGFGTNLRRRRLAVRASEIVASAWSSKSELRLEAMRELPAHRRVCPFEGLRRSSRRPPADRERQRVAQQSTSGSRCEDRYMGERRYRLCGDPDGDGGYSPSQQPGGWSLTVDSTVPTLAL